MTRFNIWEKSVDEDGNVIPLHKREVTPIIYYPNVQHAEDLLDVSESVIGEWNKAFQEMYFAIHDEAGTGKYDSVDDVDVDLVEFRKNDCHADNVVKVIDALDRDVADQVEAAAGFTATEIQNRLASIWAEDNPATFTQKTDDEDQAHLDLERICTALEWYTADDETPFRYQRPGDLRYNLINLVVKRAQTGWLGLGPMLADPLSGETIQAVSNINMAYLDGSAANAARQMGTQLGELELNDLVRGTDIQNYTREHLAQVSTVAKGVPTEHVMQEMDQRMDNLREAGQLFQEVSPNYDRAQRERLVGTPMELKMIAPDDVALFGGVSPDADALTDDLDDLLLDKVSPFRGGNLWEDLRAEEQRLAEQVKMPFDGPEFVDQLTVGISLQYRDMSYEERFKAIRRATFRSVLLHELGHNMGLGHNMAGSGDALNFGPRFWYVQSLDPDLFTAANTEGVSAADKAQLELCLAEMDGDDPKDLVNLHDGFTMTTQDCLRQQEGMYSSIMDYHTSWNSDNNGLGPYDIAAIKFGYAQLVETFPEENLVAEGELKDWLFLNDWRDIPEEFLSSSDAIQTRGHHKYTWGQASTQMTPPANEVPYKYCLDSGGNFGPECKAWDFGPDFRTRAKWMEITYWQYYFFSHFSRDRLWDWRRGAWTGPVNRDLRVFLNYNQIMKWYYYYKATMPEFEGSYAEQDFLQATMMGLNHYSHVLGHPSSGEFVSVPRYSVETLMWDTVPEDGSGSRFEVTDRMIPFDWLGTCTAYYATDVENGIPTAPSDGFTLTSVPLGDGRPFFAEWTDDYEDWYVTYIGSFYPKRYVGLAMGSSYSFFPRTQTIDDRRFFHVNWYRLFPKQVAKMMHAVITGNNFEYGPVVDPEGNFHHRDLIDLTTGESPDYSDYKKVYPYVSSYLSYYAMVDAAFSMSYTGDGQLDMVDMMRVALEGSEDDLSAFEQADPEDVATFVHPVSGLTYRALKVGETPVGYDMVQRLNTHKERYLRLEACVNDEAARTSDPYCHCIETSTPAGYCCNERNEECPEPFTFVPGSEEAGEECTLADLRDRRDSAQERMNLAADLVDDLRFFVQYFDNRF